MIHLVEILLPLTADARDHIELMRDELVEKFGGVTMHVNTPAEGLWTDKGKVEHDKVVVVEVMTDQLDHEWWRNYRKKLEAQLAQKEIIVRASKCQRL